MHLAMHTPARYIKLGAILHQTTERCALHSSKTDEHSSSMLSLSCERHIINLLDNEHLLYCCVAPLLSNQNMQLQILRSPPRGPVPTLGRHCAASLAQLPAAPR